MNLNKDEKEILKEYKKGNFSIISNSKKKALKYREYAKSALQRIRKARKASKTGKTISLEKLRKKLENVT